MARFHACTGICAFHLWFYILEPSSADVCRQEDTSSWDWPQLISAVWKRHEYWASWRAYIVLKDSPKWQDRDLKYVWKPDEVWHMNCSVAELEKYKKVSAYEVGPQLMKSAWQILFFFGDVTFGWVNLYLLKDSLILQSDLGLVKQYLSASPIWRWLCIRRRIRSTDAHGRQVRLDKKREASQFCFQKA